MNLSDAQGAALAATRDALDTGSAGAWADAAELWGTLAIVAVASKRAALAARGAHEARRAAREAARAAGTTADGSAIRAATWAEAAEVAERWADA